MSSAPSDNAPPFSPSVNERFFARRWAFALWLFALHWCLPGCFHFVQRVPYDALDTISTADIGLLLWGMLLVFFTGWLRWIPDWSSFAMVTTLLIVSAMTATFLLSLSLFAAPTHSWVLDLGLQDSIGHWSLRGWCLITIVIATAMSLSLGRVTATWRKRLNGETHQPTS